MEFSARTFQAATLVTTQRLRQACRAPARLPIAWRAVGAALLMIVLGRLLPASAWSGVDQLLGRPGDTLLLLAVVVLVASCMLMHRRPVTLSEPTAGTAASAAATAILETHLQLDQAIDSKLDEVVGDTESSALAIIGDVRSLYDSASELVNYLDGSSIKANDIGQEILDSVEFLVEIGSFIEQMPETMARDQTSVASVVTEIRAMSGLVEAVHAIGMQSHLLAINAAIEASRAGPSGAAFRVIAQEMRVLASNSSGVANQINQGLGRARHVVEDGMAAGLADSARRLQEVSLAAVSIKKLQENFEDMTQYYKTRFVVVTKYNEDLAREIADVLGHIQYQDVVRQCVERIRTTTGQRNDFFAQAVAQMAGSGNARMQAPQQLRDILDNFLAEEAKHVHSARHGDSSGELKIELF